MAFKNIFKTLKRKFGKKERAQIPTGPYLYNVSMMDVVRKEWDLALELQQRSAAPMMVNADVNKIRELLGKKVDMIDSESSEADESISSESTSDDALSLASTTDEKEKGKDDMECMSLGWSTGLNASQHRDVAAERDILSLMSFGHSSNKSAVRDTRVAVDTMNRRLNHGNVQIAARSEKAVLTMMGFGANAERICSPTEKEVLDKMGFSRCIKKGAAERYNEKLATNHTVKIKEYNAQIGAQASVSVGASVRFQCLSGGMGGAQAFTYPAMAHQESIVERCDPDESATSGVGVKIDSSFFIQGLVKRGTPFSHTSIRCDVSPNANSKKASVGTSSYSHSNAKEMAVPRSVLRSTNFQVAPRRAPVALTRKSGKENMSSNFYMNPRAAPTPPPTMPSYIQRAIQAVKEWDADIAEDSFWAEV